MPSKKAPATKPSATVTPPPAAMFDTDPAATPAPAEPVEPDTSSEATIAEPEAPVSAEGPVDEQPAPAGEAVAAPADEARTEPETETREPEQPLEGSGEQGSDPEPALADEAAPSDTSVRVRLGQVEGLLHRVPIDDVQAQFPNFADRIVTLQGSPSIANLQQRMLATEGRCAPVVVTIDHEERVLAPLAGIESVAAALNIGLSHVFVIMIDAEDAGDAQRHCVDNAQGQPLSSKTDCYQVIPA